MVQARSLGLWPTPAILMVLPSRRANSRTSSHWNSFSGSNIADGVQAKVLPQLVKRVASEATVMGWSRLYKFCRGISLGRAVNGEDIAGMGTKTYRIFLGLVLYKCRGKTRCYAGRLPTIQIAGNARIPATRSLADNPMQMPKIGAGKNRYLKMALSGCSQPVGPIRNAPQRSF